MTNRDREQHKIVCVHCVHTVVILGSLGGRGVEIVAVHGLHFFTSSGKLCIERTPFRAEIRTPLVCNKGASPPGFRRMHSEQNNLRKPCWTRLFYTSHGMLYLHAHHIKYTCSQMYLKQSGRKLSNMKSLGNLLQVFRNHVFTFLEGLLH